MGKFEGGLRPPMQIPADTPPVIGIPSTSPVPQNPEAQSKTNKEEESQKKGDIPAKILKRIILKRRHIHLLKLDAGHWWVEIYEDEENYFPDKLEASFGWYPFVDDNGDGRHEVPGLWGVLTGVNGDLNQRYPFDPHAHKDYVDWNVDEMYHPVIFDNRTERVVIDDIKRFSDAYKFGNKDAREKKWCYPGIMHSRRSNCHVFQLELMEPRDCDLSLASLPVQMPYGADRLLKDAKEPEDRISYPSWWQDVFGDVSW